MGNPMQERLTGTITRERDGKYRLNIYRGWKFRAAYIYESYEKALKAAQKHKLESADGHFLRV